MIEVTDGNDGALAAGIALAATMQSFVCTHETSHVGTNMAHRVLNSSTQENGHLTKQKRAGPRGEIKLIGLTWVCLQLNCCCDSQRSYSYNRLFPSRSCFLVKHSVLCVCVFSSHPFWTSSSLDVPAGVTQQEGHTGFFNPPSFCGACLDFCREKDSAIPFSRRP